MVVDEQKAKVRADEATEAELTKRRLEAEV